MFVCNTGTYVPITNRTAYSVHQYAIGQSSSKEGVVGMEQLYLKEYLVPKSVKEALELLDGYEGSIGVVAGATDVFADNNPAFDALLDITKIGLNYIEFKDNMLFIGSCTTFRQLIKSHFVKEKFKALWEASQVIADMTVRNVATVGGNICSAVPSGDAIPPMFAVDANFVLISKKGERIVKPQEFFTGPRRTILKNNEIIKEFRIALPDTPTESAFEKIARNSVDLANANVAVSISCKKDGTISDAKIALGSVAPTVVRAKEAERTLIGKMPDEKTLQDLYNKIPSAISPITNIRSTKEYRAEVLKVLVRKAVLRSYESVRA